MSSAEVKQGRTARRSGASSAYASATSIRLRVCSDQHSHFNQIATEGPTKLSALDPEKEVRPSLQKRDAWPVAELSSSSN